MYSEETLRKTFARWLSKNSQYYSITDKNKLLIYEVFKIIYKRELPLKAIISMAGKTVFFDEVIECNNANSRRLSGTHL